MAHDIPNPSHDRLIQALKDQSDSHFETSLIKLIYEIDAGEEVTEIYIGETKSDRDDGSSKQAISRINELCEALGINPTKWTEVLLGGVLEGLSGPHTISKREARGIQLDGETIGEYLTRRAFDVLPIEMDEEGDGKVTLSLALESDHVLNLRADGNFYTEWADEDDDEGDTEVWFEMKYKADVLRYSR